MKISRIVATIVLFFLLFGCSNSQPNMLGTSTLETIPTTKPTQTSYLISTPVVPGIDPTTTPVPQRFTPSITPTPTSSYTPPKPTDTLAVTPTATPAKVRFAQLEITDNFSPNREFTGTLILSGYYNFGSSATPDKDINSDSYLYNLDTGAKFVFAKKYDTFWSYQVSHDPRWLLYETYSDMVITTADWTENIKIPRENDWMAIEWLNDDTLVIRKNISDGNIDKQRGSAGGSSLLLLNPFTGQRKEILPDFPDIWNPDPCWRIGCLLPDPAMTLILYPVMWDNKPFVLWDLQAGKEITRLSYGGLPAWSPDSKQLSIVRNTGSGDEFYIVSRNGQMTRLTQMTSSFPNVSVAAYSWSPDSRYIAFWMARDRGLPYRLAIVDTQIGVVQEYSIQADFKQGAPFPDYLVVTNSIAPIWSPNGNQLLVDSFDPEKNLRSVIIIDTEKGFAVKVVDNMIPVGWMTGP